MTEDWKLRTRLLVALLAIWVPFTGLLAFGDLSPSLSIVVMALVFIASVTSVIVVTARVSKPLERLTEAAVAISEGKSATIPGARGGAEVKALSRSLALVVQSLANAEEELGIRAEMLETANRSKDEFVGFIAHELRNPLTVILGNAQLLMAKRTALPASEVEAMLRDVHGEAERMLRVLNDLLAIARDEMGQEIELMPLSTVALVRTAVAAFQRFSPGRLVQVEISPSVGAVLGDKTYVEQILGNLLSNADKYSPPEDSITVAVKQSRSDVVFSVLDRGPGLPDAELPKIFDAFFRSKLTDSRAPGKGLGLTVCKRLAEAMGGKVWAQPRTSGGLEVSFSLPGAVDADQLT